MKQQIEAILSAVKAPSGCEFNGKYWSAWIGDHGDPCEVAGAREDGISLAHDLKSQYEARKAKEAPVPRPAHAYTAEPEPVEIPAFLKEPQPPKETVPEAIADLIRENEPYGEAKIRLMALYCSLQNKLMLGLASEAEGRMHTRLHGHLAWMTKGAADVTI